MPKTSRRVSKATMVLHDLLSTESFRQWYEREFVPYGQHMPPAERQDQLLELEEKLATAKLSFEQMTARQPVKFNK